MISQLAKQTIKRTIDHANGDDDDQSRTPAGDDDELGSLDDEHYMKRAKFAEDDTASRDSLPTAETKVDDELPVKKARARKAEFRGVSSQRGKWAAKIESAGQKLTVGVFERSEEHTFEPQPLMGIYYA